MLGEYSAKVAKGTEQIIQHTDLLGNVDSKGRTSKIMTPIDALKALEAYNEGVNNTIKALKTLASGKWNLGALFNEKNGIDRDTLYDVIKTTSTFRGDLNLYEGTKSKVIWPDKHSLKHYYNNLYISEPPNTHGSLTLITNNPLEYLVTEEFWKAQRASAGERQFA
jgi:hypothetical protein